MFEYRKSLAYNTSEAELKTQEQKPKNEFFFLSQPKKKQFETKKKAIGK